MTNPRAPWWYSGDDLPTASVPDEKVEAPAPPVGESTDGLDWTSLVVGAQRVVEWATERVMAPHAEHELPSDHPECVVCRTMLVLGEPGTGAKGDAPPSTGAEWDAMAPQSPGPGQIQWIPVTESPPAP